MGEGFVGGADVAGEITRNSEVSMLECGGGLEVNRGTTTRPTAASTTTSPPPAAISGTLDFSFGFGYPFFNINTPEDLAAAEASILPAR